MNLLPSTNRGGRSRLPSLNFITGIETSDEEKRSFGYAGFVGSLMLFIAFFAMALASIDPLADSGMVNAYSFIYLGGFMISLGFGFTLMDKKQSNKGADLGKETIGVFLGIVTGALILGIMAFLTYFGTSFATNESVAFALLAPVAETMAFVIAPYHLFKYNFPRAHWISLALPADVIFTVFHFSRYGATWEAIIIWVILVIGNTLFVYIYHLTKNATAPMIAHLIVNLASNTQPVIEYLYATLPLFVGLFILFAVIYYFIGEFVRK